MGFEYRIQFAHPSESELDCAIRAMPFFRDYDDRHRIYNLWFDPAAAKSGMPDAYAAIEPYGIYFCDNRSPDKSQISDSLVAIAKQFDPHVVVEEL